jgi:hypothetical protein
MPPGSSSRRCKIGCGAKEVRVDALARAQLERSSWLWRKNPEAWTAGEESRWAQLKDKPLVTGLSALNLLSRRAGVC